MGRVRTSPAVRILLWALLVYVVLMLTLIAVRFLRIFPTETKPAVKTSVVLVASRSVARV